MKPGYSTHWRCAMCTTILGCLGCGRRLPSLGEESLGIFGKRGKFQTHACYFGVQGLTDDHLGINVREWWMPWWLQGEPDIGIGCDLPLNRGLGVVRTSQTEQSAGDGCLRDHFAFNEKTGHGQRRCQGHEGFCNFFWQCQPICSPDTTDLVERHRLIETLE